MSQQKTKRYLCSKFSVELIYQCHSLCLPFCIFCSACHSLVLFCYLYSKCYSRSLYQLLHIFLTCHSSSLLCVWYRCYVILFLLCFVPSACHSLSAVFPSFCISFCCFVPSARPLSPSAVSVPSACHSLTALFRIFCMSFSFCCIFVPLAFPSLSAVCCTFSMSFSFCYVFVPFGMSFSLFLVWVLNLFTVLPRKPMLQSTLQQPVPTTDVDNRCALL